MGDGALGGGEADLHAVKADVRLAHVQVDAAAGGAPLYQDLGEGAHVFEEGQKVRVFGAKRLVSAEDGRDLGIGHAGAGADDAAFDAAFRHLPLPIDGHEAGEGQPVFPLPQRADVVRKRFGEHGDDAVGKIHAGAAAVRLGVEGAAAGDVVRHVGNVHAEKEAVPFPPHGDGVVKVARVVAVDGDDGLFAKVGAPLACDGKGCGALCPREHLLRKFFRQLLRTDDRLFFGQ